MSCALTNKYPSGALAAVGSGRRAAARNGGACWGALAAAMLWGQVPGVQTLLADEFDSAGVKIHYTVQGEGEPVVLIHGFSASGTLNWGLPGTTSLVAQHFRTIVIDNRGHGGSDKPLEVDAYGTQMVDDVLRLLDHLQIERAHLVGYSMGGLITLKLLAEHPQRVRSAVVGGMGWLETAGPEAATYTAGDAASGRRPLAACLRSFPQLGITREQLLAVRIPFTVVIGADDGLYQRRVKPLAAVRPDVPVVVVPAANHLSCVMKPEFRQAIRDFLDAHRGAAAL